MTLPRSIDPHLTFRTAQGQEVHYGDVWQRTQLLLVVLPAGDHGAWTSYVADLEAIRARVTALETTLIVSDDAHRFDAPMALVADRWGEVTHSSRLGVLDDVVTPDVETLLVWVEAVLHRCAECEGEAR